MGATINEVLAELEKLGISFVFKRRTPAFLFLIWRFSLLLWRFPLPQYVFEVHEMFPPFVETFLWVSRRFRLFLVSETGDETRLTLPWNIGEPHILQQSLLKRSSYYISHIFSHSFENDLFICFGIEGIGFLPKADFCNQNWLGQIYHHWEIG